MINRWPTVEQCLVAIAGVLFVISALILIALLEGCSAPSPGALVTKAEAVEFDSAPPAARKYRAELTRNARLSWGLEAPVPMLAGQVQAESNFNPTAGSAAGAKGIAQFIDSTAAAFPDEQGRVDVYSPSWSFRAQALYMKQIRDRMSGATECDRRAMALRGYNAGERWVTKAQAKAPTLGYDSQRYFDHVENVNAGQSAAAFAENQPYARKILLKFQPAYRVWGPLTCEEMLS